MQLDELRSFLTAFAADRVALILRHEAGARAVSHYDFNNAYQYVIAREETHLSWLRSALDELKAPMPAAASEIPVPPVPKPGKNAEASVYRDILEDDARHLAAFIERWRPRVTALTHVLDVFDVLELPLTADEERGVALIDLAERCVLILGAKSVDDLAHRQVQRRNLLFGQVDMTAPSSPFSTSRSNSVSA